MHTTMRIKKTTKIDMNVMRAKCAKAANTHFYSEGEFIEALNKKSAQIVKLFKK